MAQRNKKGNLLLSEPEVSVYFAFNNACSQYSNSHPPTHSQCVTLSVQARVRAISEIVNALVQSVKNGEDIDLNNVKKEVGTKYSLSKAPKLVEIIAALPEEHKTVLLPQYVAPFYTFAIYIQYMQMCLCLRISQMNILSIYT